MPIADNKCVRRHVDAFDRRRSSTKIGYTRLFAWPARAEIAKPAREMRMEVTMMTTPTAGRNGAI